MRIGVLSDSHTNSLEALPGKAIDELTGVDLIIHAGDYTGKDVLDGLRELGDFKGVHGNMDPPEIKAELPETEFFEVMGFRIGVAHPSEGGIPFRLWRRVRERRLEGEKLTVEARPLKPEEAIGKPTRGDYPLLKGCLLYTSPSPRD